MDPQCYNQDITNSPTNSLPPQLSHNSPRRGPSSQSPLQHGGGGPHPVDLYYLTHPAEPDVKLELTENVQRSFPQPPKEMSPKRKITAGDPEFPQVETSTPSATESPGPPG